MTNFNEDEFEYAHHLLNAFMYYSTPLVEQLFAAGFQSLSTLDRRNGRRFPEAQSAWEAFCGSLIVTYVTGEQPNPTDSGFAFARMARQVLGIEEERIVAPEKALSLLVSDPNRPVLFVDDFVGSGDQFIKTWHRPHAIPSHGEHSFARQALAGHRARYHYCPAVCTAYGAREIATHCPGNLVLRPGNWLPDQNSAIHPESVVWPDQLRASGEQFVESASHRAGIPDHNGGVGDWRGYRKLGLTLAFSHSTPDATLPLFYFEENNWRPLIRRR